MIRVLDIWQEAKKIVGNADDAFLFRRITDAVELLANKGDFDPCLGTIDIAVENCVVTLPQEVETILAVSMCGKPAVLRDELFQFHLNGPGACGSTVRHEVMDLNESCVFRQPELPSYLRGYCVDPEDADAEVWVEGYDEDQNVIRTKVGDTWRNGWKLPIFSEVVATPSDAPKFSRIANVVKSVTAGPIRMTAIGEGSEYLLGEYQGDTEVPRFRRVKLNRPASWVRIFFRRPRFVVRSKYDLLPMHSTQAVVMAIRALKAYDSPGGIAEGEQMEATATRWITEEQFTRSAPVVHPIQVVDAAPLVDPCDVME